MRASQVIARSEVCRQAARNLYPQDPDELYQRVWLAIAEKEIREPEFNPKNPKGYFIRSMRNQVIEWHRKNVDTVPISKLKECCDTTNESMLPCKAFVEEWINEPTDDEDVLFLKNILTLALNCDSNNDAIKLIGISHRQYYQYKLQAKQKLYDDYRASINSDISSADLV